MDGPISAYLHQDHVRLGRLLDQALPETGTVDPGAFEAFRGGLLRHIGLEEKLLRRARGGDPLPIAPALRLEHGALAALLMPTPTAGIIGEIRALLERHNRQEEGPAGVYAQCEGLLGPAEQEELAAPEVPLAPHFDGPGVHRTAASALAALAGRPRQAGGRAGR